MAMKENSEIPSFAYSDRYVCFFDLLGCHDLINQSVLNIEALNKVKEVIDLFYKTQNSYVPPHWNSNFIMPITKDGETCDRCLSENQIEVDMSLFSDSIIISYKPKKTDRFVTWYSQLYQIANDLCKLQFLFASKGFFLRGGLSYGKLFHKGNLCFGPALLEAVELEDKMALNPCIAISNVIMKPILDGLKSNEIDDYAPGYKTPHTMKAFAEDFFGTYIERADIYRKDMTGPVFILDWLASRFYSNPHSMDIIKPIIMEELSKDYPQKVKAKYEWLKNYYNRAIYFADGHSHMKIE